MTQEGAIAYRLEVVQVPVADVDRARAFYEEAMGFVLDHDAEVGPGVRVVQLTPPGSHCSIVLGTGLSDMPPGSLRGLQLVVDDLDAARADLLSRGVPIGAVRLLGAPGRPAFAFAFLDDPDGNGWAVQEATPRPAA